MLKVGGIQITQAGRRRQDFWPRTNKTASYAGYSLRGDRSFRPEPLRIPPLEDIEFLDEIQIKIQNIRFKSLTNDQTVPRYRYFNFFKPHKVDGKGFSPQMPTLKTVPSDQKSNRRTCALVCQMPFKKRKHF